MIEKIVEYQKVDGTLNEIENELAGSEERKKAVTAKKFLDSVSDKLAEIEGKASILIETFNKQESDMKELKEKVAEFSQIVDSCNDAQEIEYYKKKISEYIGVVKNFEKIASNLKKEIADLMELYKGLKKNTDLAKAQYKEFAPKYQELKNAKQEEMSSIQKQLLKMEKDIDADILNIYKQKRKDKIYPIFYKVDEVEKEYFCSYCRTGLAMSAKTSLSKDGYVECDNCHRILYNLSGKK